MSIKHNTNVLKHNKMVKKPITQNRHHNRKNKGGIREIEWRYGMDWKDIKAMYHHQLTNWRTVKNLLAVWNH